MAGWLTELSGMMYGLVQLGSYLKLYAFAALFVVLFLGGWNGPSIFQWSQWLKLSLMVLL
uniref:NADH dehydrogenase (NuoH) n=1 Tax=uncultured marine thaumarchaeote AD1000_30_G09 TaxID=1455905 RepID=A0A075FNR8_9ARCH|nr:NADH dehydrogenase (nuoH) [uncultured marine thaumarchaeote AD1000_30_G09]